MSVKKIKIAVLGCSSIAERQVIPAIIQCERFELGYVASRNIEKGEQFAKKFGCKHCSYDQLIENSEIDAVYLSLPVGLHYEYGKKIIASGKHLLMEKTFTDSLKKTKEIINAAEKNNLVAMEVLVYVYHPLYKKVTALLNDNAIGEIKHIDAYFGFPLPPAKDIRRNSEIGGGAILDSLIYPLSFCLNITELKPQELNFISVFNKSENIDERGSLQIKFGNITAHIVFGFGMMYRNNYCIWGSTGYLMADRVFSRPADLKGEIIIVKQNERQNIPVEDANQFVNMLNSFADKIQKKTNDTLNEGENILNRMAIISRLLLKTRKSALKWG